MSQQQAPTFINLPPPPSNLDTPSETPGTPTSTTTSLSALSTTAIKDGHRGHAQAPPFLGGSTSRGHHQNASTNSLEAERADRISRLAGLERVSTIRAGQSGQANRSSDSPQTTPTSSGFPAQQIAALPGPPAYFDNNGQPVQMTKMSTVGTASATGSAGRTTGGTEMDTNPDRDEDMMSLDTNDRETEMDSVTGAVDPMDEDMASRSVGGFRDDEDRISDDGTASLVGFGEGANSTVSGPIYHRRPVPGVTGTFERSASGLSDAAQNRMREAEGTPVSSSVANERRDAMMMDGVSVGDGGHVGAADDGAFVDTTATGPVPARGSGPPPQHGNVRFGPSSTSREAAEQIVRERLDGGEGKAGTTTLGRSGDKLGHFYFEENK